MKVRLKAHNQETFENICELFKTHRKVAVEQATGSGKSFVVAETISAFSKKRTLFITSGKAIIYQFSNSKDLKEIVDMSNIDFMTYQKTLTINLEEMRGKYDLIILDEYHRAGAPKWNVSINQILEEFESAKVLGVTATPTRDLDNGRNMTEELFDGVVANRISLSEAIEKEILPSPKYVLTMYDYHGQLPERTDKESYVTLEEILNKVKYMINNLESCYDPARILKKYVTSERKFIVFCESIEHLESVRLNLNRWFVRAFGVKVNNYVIHSAKYDHEEVMDKFKRADSEEFHLLLVVNMLNEGVHIPIDGLIFLRSTKSSIIYYQQLGRALTSSNVDKSPLIFDFVKNSDNLFKTELKFFFTQEKNRDISKISRPNYELCGYFELYDEMIHYREFMKEVEIFRKGWFKVFVELAKYHDRGGDVNKIDKNEYPSLWHFVADQKKSYFFNRLTEQQIEYLEKININWDYKGGRNKVMWERRLEQIKKYYDKHGNLDVPRSETSLYKFLSEQRSLYAKGELNESRVEDLIKLGVDLTSKSRVKSDKPKKITQKKITLEERYQQMKLFKDEFGHCDVPRTYKDSSFAEWVHYIRSSKCTLSEEFKTKLIELGFNFNYGEDKKEKRWQEMYKRLIEFKKEFGHCRVSSRYKDRELSNWARTQKRAYVAGKMNEGRYNKLIEIGFEF